MNTISNSALAWLLTYAVHSTLLIALAWVLSRRAGTSLAARDFLWKVALVGGVVTATVQLEAGMRPRGSLALRAAAADAVTAVEIAPPDVPTTDVEVSPPAAADVQVNARTGKTVGVSDALAADRASSPANPSPDALTPPQPLARRASPETIAVWGWAIAAVLLAAGYFARRLILVGRLGDRRILKEGPLPGMLDALRLAARYRGRVRITVSNTISSPVALGLGEICIPEAALTDLDAEQQRGLLAHELAHLARRDPLWLDSVSLMERVFFFQPFNRLARRELQHVAEYMCDDWAAARTGSGVPLAKCLARVAEWIQSSPLGVPVPGMAEQRSLLVARIARLIDGRAASIPAPRLVLAGAALGLLGVIVAAAPGVQGTAAQPTKDSSVSRRESARSRGPADLGALGRAPRISGLPKSPNSAPHLAGPGAPAGLASWQASTAGRYRTRQQIRPSSTR
jgi:beta-lactamase regulating signal transducer with metallopeptidase domain